MSCLQGCVGVRVIPGCLCWIRSPSAIAKPSRRNRKYDRLSRLRKYGFITSPANNVNRKIVELDGGHEGPAVVLARQSENEINVKNARIGRSPATPKIAAVSKRKL